MIYTNKDPNSLRRVLLLIIGGVDKGLKTISENVATPDTAG